MTILNNSQLFVNVMNEISHSFPEASIDWDKLREQKLLLLYLADEHFAETIATNLYEEECVNIMGKEVAILLNGLIHFLDSFQDAAAGLYGDMTVFPQACGPLGHQPSLDSSGVCQHGFE